jgi:hypothetical protein
MGRFALSNCWITANSKVISGHSGSGKLRDCGRATSKQEVIEFISCLPTIRKLIGSVNGSALFAANSLRTRTFHCNLGQGEGTSTDSPFWGQVGASSDNVTPHPLPSYFLRMVSTSSAS